MEFAYDLSGGAPVVKKYQAGEAFATAGVLAAATSACADDENNSSIKIYSNEAIAPPDEGLMGVTIDTTTSFPADTNGQVNADANILVSVVVNPHGVWRGLLTGSASAANTALGIETTTGASATGNTLTGVTALQDGAVWGYSGANAGNDPRQALTATTVAMSFAAAIASGDQFLVAPGYIGHAGTPTRAFLNLNTDDYTQIDATQIDSDNDNLVIVDWELRDETDSGTTNSYYHVMANNHVFGGNVSLT